MPYPLRLYNVELKQYSVDYTEQSGTVLTLSTGEDWRDGDMRVAICHFSMSSAGGNTFDISSHPNWSKPRDVSTTLTHQGGSNFRQIRSAVLFRRLDEASVDEQLTLSTVTQFPQLFVHLFTVRNPHLGQVWIGADNNSASYWYDSATLTVPSLSPTAGGLKVATVNEYQPLGAVPTPSGLTRVAERARAGASDSSHGMLLGTQEFPAGGATGTNSVAMPLTDSYVSTAVFLYTNPDITVPVGVASTETDTAFAFTPSLLNLVTFPVGAAVESDTAGHLYTPLSGRWTAPSLPVPEGVVTASVVHWTQTVPPGTSVVVETSIDGGLTWQPATNFGPVPHLSVGTTAVREVLHRGNYTRSSVLQPSPRIRDIQIDVTVDQSHDELCPLGVFTINDVSVVDSPAGVTVEIAGADLSRRVARNRWSGTYLIRGFPTYDLAIRRLILNRMPDAIFNFATSNREMSKTVLGQSGSTDPWADARRLAEDIGMELYFDAAGQATLRDEPDPATDSPVWEFEDTSFPTVTALTRQILDEDTYNQVVVEGEASGNTAPVRAVAQDLDPASPTYILGPYGINSITIRSAGVTTTEQARDAADAKLLRAKGATEKVVITAVPNPAIEPGDVVTVTRGLSKVEGQFIVDAITMPLSPTDAMTITSRRQRL